MDMTYWDTFQGQPVFIHEEGGSYFLSPSEDPDEEKYWLEKLIEIHDEKPDELLSFGKLVLPISEFQPLLTDITSFLDSIGSK